MHLRACKRYEIRPTACSTVQLVPCIDMSIESSRATCFFVVDLGDHLNQNRAMLELTKADFLLEKHDRLAHQLTEDPSEPFPSEELVEPRMVIDVVCELLIRLTESEVGTSSLSVLRCGQLCSNVGEAIPGGCYPSRFTCIIRYFHPTSSHYMACARPFYPASP